MFFNIICNRLFIPIPILICNPNVTICFFFLQLGTFTNFRILYCSYYVFIYFKKKSYIIIDFFIHKKGARENKWCMCSYIMFFWRTKNGTYGHIIPHFKVSKIAPYWNLKLPIINSEKNNSHFTQMIHNNKYDWTSNLTLI